MLADCPYNSGKGSPLLTLLRMLDFQPGSIKLDDVDITLIPQDFLRERCFVTVSHYPLLLPFEALRLNIDPSRNVGNDVLIPTQAKVGLWEHFRDTIKSRESSDDMGDMKDTFPGTTSHPHHQHRILDLPLYTFLRFSFGQRQLFALCRGLVRANTLHRTTGVRLVLLLDEVTAMLNAETEAVVHGTVESEFVGRGHTVVMVSHRSFGVGAEGRKRGERSRGGGWLWRGGMEGWWRLRLCEV